MDLEPGGKASSDAEEKSTERAKSTHRIWGAVLVGTFNLVKLSEEEALGGGWPESRPTVSEGKNFYEKNVAKKRFRSVLQHGRVPIHRGEECEVTCRVRSMVNANGKTN